MMNPLEKLIYIELNEAGDPQVLYQRRSDGDGTLDYVRIWDVFGATGGLRTADADAPQPHFYLRATDDIDLVIDPLGHDLPAHGATCWSATAVIRLSRRAGTATLVDAPDLTAFWARAEFEEGSEI